VLYHKTEVGKETKEVTKTKRANVTETQAKKSLIGYINIFTAYDIIGMDMDEAKEIILDFIPSQKDKVTIADYLTTTEFIYNKL
jgi:DNA-nicking Smr family endonuclease